MGLGMSSKRERQQAAPALKSFAKGMVVMSAAAPRQLSMAQAAFFVAAALSDRAGKATTYTELKEELGPVVSRSLNTTYKIFLKEGRLREGQRVEGLGWLEAEVDPHDNRRRYLRLTPAGERIIDEIARAISG